MINIMHTGTSKRVVASALLFFPLVAWGIAGVDLAAAQAGAAAAKSLAQKAAKPSRVAAKSAAKEKQQESKTTARAAEGNLRDPFSIPKPMLLNASAEGAEGTMIVGSLPAGTRGLMIDQIKLEGIVRVGSTNPKMIAVLSNPAHRAYFLHENDQLYDGVVTKITPDEVHFMEEYRDPSGKTATREVIRKLAPAPGEKK